MTERIMNVDALSPYLIAIYPSGMVKVREDNRVVTIVESVEEADADDGYKCPLGGIAAESSLTVEKLLEWKREERELEYERDIRLGRLRPDNSLPNAETITAIREAEEGIDMHECESLQQLFKELKAD